MNKPVHSLIIRIDDRLIHGQVIVGWVRTLNIKNIVVVNEELLNDAVKLEMTKLAIPSDISIEFVTIEMAAELYKKNTWECINTIILLESPKDAFQFISLIGRVAEINVGGLHIVDDRKLLTDNIAVNEEDVYYLQELVKMNIKLEGRALPKDEAFDVEKLLHKIK